MKNQRNTEAVSEILGEVLLLAIAVTSISVIYMQVLSTPGPTDTTTVSILGEIEKGQPVFELQRGESLGSDTRIIMTSAGLMKEEFVLNDPVFQKYIHNQEWDIGERIILPVNDTTGIQVEATIVDTKTNSIVFWGALQKGLTFRYRGGIWHFDEPEWNGVYDEVKDSSGNNNHGRAIGNASIITQPIAKCNNSGDFNGFIDVIKVNTSWTLNITNAITIEAWMKPRPPDLIADIVGLSELFGYTPYITHVNKEIYALIMETQIKAGFLQTVKINEEGFITSLDTEELNKGKADTLVRPVISQITEKMVLVSLNAKKGSKLFIQMRTYNISDSGLITYTGYELVLEDYQCPADPNDPNRPSLVKITNTIWAIAYRTLNNGGVLRTLNISSNGKITCIDTKTFDFCSEPYLAHVTGDVYALAYRNTTSNQGSIRTFNITSTGIISMGQRGMFDTLSGYEPCLVQVSGELFAIAFRDSSNNGIVKTLNISATGSIVFTDKTMVFEPNVCVNPRIIHCEDNMYIIVYQSAINPESAIGCVIMITVRNDGSISSIMGSEQFFDYNACGNPIIINIDYGLYGICYTGHGAHPGFLITMLIGPHARGICKGTSYMLYANTTMVEGCINNVFVRYYNDSLDVNWNHYTVTYDGMSICLYVNGIKVNETIYPFHRIKLTKTPLYFGRTYCGFLDEIAIYDQALTQQQIQYHTANPGALESYYL